MWVRIRLLSLIVLAVSWMRLNVFNSQTWYSFLVPQNTSWLRFSNKDVDIYIFILKFLMTAGCVSFNRWLLSKDLSVWTIYLQASFYIFLICHKNLKTRKLIKLSNVDIEISQHLYIFILKFLMTAGFVSFNRWPLDKDLSVSWVIHPQPKFYFFLI